MWTKKDSYRDLGDCLDWNASRQYVADLTTGGYSDWQIPTVKELKEIYEKSKSNKDFEGDKILLDPIFAKKGGYRYWSSEERRFDEALAVDFFDCSVISDHQANCSNYSVRAVRH